MRKHVWVFAFESGRGWCIEVYDFLQPAREAVFQLMAEGLHLEYKGNWESIEADPRCYDLRRYIQQKDICNAIEEWNDMMDEFIILLRVPVDISVPKIQNRIAENGNNPADALELLKQLREKT